MNRKIKLISIDGDGCLFAYTNVGSHFHSSWDALGFAYGLKDVWDERIKKYYKPNAFDQQWAEEDIAEIGGKEMRVAESVLHPIPYSPGAREFLQASKGKLVRGLLSSCIDLAGKKAADETALDFCICNVLHHRDGIFSGTLDYTVPTWQKHLHISDLCHRFEVTPEEICHVGDNENDIPCFEQAGLAVAFKPKKESVGQAAKYIIDDFRELAAILGL